MSDDSWWLDWDDLDDEQKRLVGLPSDESHLILGPPGSGKTNLVLLQGSYLVGSGQPNVVVLMFTRSLREFIVRGASNYKVPEDRISTIMKWATQLLREQGDVVDDLPEPFPERRLEVARRLVALLKRRPALQGSLECILVDEVQDCLEDELDSIFKLGHTVFLAGDERQRIYRGKNVLDGLASRVAVHRLTHHYRNGREICKAADAIGRTSGERPILPTCNYNEARNPSKVEFVPCANAGEQGTRISDRLKLEVKAYPGELLAVACARNEDVAEVRARLEKSLLAPMVIEGTFSGAGDRCIFIGSLHDLKGLEFRAVHLAHMQGISRMGEVQKRLTYTAVTRAKTRLTFYWIESVPGYVEQARAAIEGPKQPPDKKTLFPGRH